MFSQSLCGFSLRGLRFLPQLKTCTLGFNIQSEPWTKCADEDLNLVLRCCTVAAPKEDGSNAENAFYWTLLCTCDMENIFFFFLKQLGFGAYHLRLHLSLSE